jgi:hypothetical protein
MTEEVAYVSVIAKSSTLVRAKGSPSILPFLRYRGGV